MAKKKSKKIKKPQKKIKKVKKIKKQLKVIKRKTVSKPAKKPAVSLPKKLFIGTVEHFFTEISVGVIKLVKTLKTGDTISIEGTTTNFKQKVESMQIDREPVQEANKGASIGLKVKDRVREKDKVFLVK